MDAANCAVVAAHNATVDVLNALLLQAVPGPVCVATAVETLQNDDQDVAVPNMISEEHMACLHQVRAGTRSQAESWRACDGNAQLEP